MAGFPFFHIPGALLVMFLAGCSFTYDTMRPNDNDPNLMLEDAEYVRMINGNPEVRLKAGEIRHYETKHLMELDTLFFEQYNAAPEDAEPLPGINARGNAGSARFETDTRNVSLSGGVSIEVNSEDMTIQTEDVSWHDKDRLLSVPGRVNITRSDGTFINGTGLSVDVRRRSWEFESAVEGSIAETGNPSP